MSVPNSAELASPPTDAINVHGTVYPPHRCRALSFVVVETCPHCLAAHQHRAGRIVATGIIRACPVTSRPYIILPTAAAAGSQNGTT